MTNVQLSKSTFSRLGWMKRQLPVSSAKLVLRCLLLSAVPAAIVAFDPIPVAGGFLPCWLVAGICLELLRLRCHKSLPFPTLLILAALAQLTTAVVFSGGAGRGGVGLPGRHFLRSKVAAAQSLFVYSAEVVDSVLRRAQGLGPQGFALSTASLSTFSIILVAHNEQTYVQRTVDSIVANTHRRLLHEVILVDDASSPPMTLSLDQRGLPPGLVKVIRHEERQGLILARQHGGNAATGDIIVFLDCHVKPLKGWDFPIVRHLNTNYKRVAVPAIPTLNADTWEENVNAVGYKMMFEWNFAFHWFEDGSDLVPCMSGGLYAITRRWWHESGEYDPGMLAWGAENIEQSIRMWLCGGEIVVARDSKIAHVFRKSFPYRLNNTQVTVNKVRTVEVWFDDYKENYYKSFPSARQYKKSMGDISDRLAFKRRMNCQPFQSYVDRFRDIFEFRGLVDTETFLLSTKDQKTCLLPSKVVTTIHKQLSEGKSTVNGNDAFSLFLDAAKTDWQRLHKNGLIAVPCPPEDSPFEKMFRFRSAGPRFSFMEHMQSHNCLGVEGSVVEAKSCEYLKVPEPRNARTKSRREESQRALLIDDDFLIDRHCVVVPDFDVSKGKFPAVALTDCSSPPTKLFKSRKTLVSYKKK